jgi:hypothetical protein
MPWMEFLIVLGIMAEAILLHVLIDGGLIYLNCAIIFTCLVFLFPTGPRPSKHVWIDQLGVLFVVIALLPPLVMILIIFKFWLVD